MCVIINKYASTLWRWAIVMAESIHLVVHDIPSSIDCENEDLLEILRWISGLYWRNVFSIVCALWYGQEDQIFKHTLMCYLTRKGFKTYFDEHGTWFILFRYSVIIIPLFPIFWYLKLRQNLKLAFVFF